MLQGTPLTYRGTQKQELDKVVEILMQLLERTEQPSSPSNKPLVSSILPENVQPVIPQSVVLETNTDSTLALRAETGEKDDTIERREEKEEKRGMVGWMQRWIAGKKLKKKYHKR